MIGFQRPRPPFPVTSVPLSPFVVFLKLHFVHRRYAPTQTQQLVDSLNIILIMRVFTFIEQKWRRRWFVLKHSGELPGQYFLEYYTDKTCRKLKGKIDLDQCEQVLKDIFVSAWSFSFCILSFLWRPCIICE